MKKRLLTAVLAVCLALMLLPTGALASGRPDSTDYWIDMTTAEAKYMLGRVAGGTETRDIVFIYYGTDAVSQTASQQFASYAGSSKCRIYNYYTGSGESLAAELAPLFGGGAPARLPAAVIFNSSTRTYTAREYVAQLNVVGDTGNGITGLRNLLQETDMLSGSTVDNTITVPEDPGESDRPSEPGTPEIPDPPPTPPAGPSTQEQEWEVLRLVNQHRMEMGLQPLSVFSALQEAASLRARELYRSPSHTRPDGSDYSTVFSQLDIPATSWAENIASGQKDAADVMNSWLNSPGHRANIEKASGRVHLGVGYYYNEDGPALYASNWVQNFAACSDCRFSNLSLSKTSIEGRRGADLESLLAGADITVTARCNRHGTCSLPLIAAMCGGYDPNDTGNQTLTVLYGNQTATLTITGDHIHTWDEGLETTAPVCTEPGETSYTCTQCGAIKTETIPALGHSFTVESDGEYACGNHCGASIPAALKPVYEALRLSFPPTDMAEAAVVERYLLDCARKALADYAATGYLCVILDGHFIDYNTKYQYCIGIQEASSSARALSREGGYVLITEPLTVALTPAFIEDAASEAYPVVTPEENLPVTPAEPPEPPVYPPVVPARPPEASVTYSISIPKASGGTVAVSPRSAERGKRVTISVYPSDGYILDTLEVSDARGQEVPLHDAGGGAYSFTMPTSNITIAVTFKRAADDAAPAVPDIPETVPNPAPMPFTDVYSGDWFYDGVDYVWTHLLMSGVSSTQFAPGETASRAMIWTILARLHNISTEAAPDAPWYEPGMVWAMRQNVSDGTNPNGSITREQLATMLWRDAGSPSATAALDRFSDSGNVSGYAQSALSWAVENGIMQGSGGMLDPKGTASRAEVAAMLMRYAKQAG